VTVASSDLGLDGIKGFLVIKFLLVNAEPVKDTWWDDQFDENGPDDCECTTGDGDDLLVLVQWNSLEGTSTDIDEANLDYQDKEKDNNEPNVVEEADKHVVFVVQQFTGVNHVKDLHHNKGLEHKGIDGTLVGSLVKSVHGKLFWVRLLDRC